MLQQCHVIIVYYLINDSHLGSITLPTDMSMCMFSVYNCMLRHVDNSTDDMTFIVNSQQWV